MLNLKVSKLAALLAVMFGMSGFASLSLAEEVIKVDGSSTVYPITEAVAEEFQKMKKGALKVTVGISGTGGGFKKFCRDEIDIADASRPILKKEMEACAQAGVQYIEIPVAYDALTVVVNMASPLKSITVAELKKMWEPTAQGTIKQWKQVNPAWTDAPLKLFGPGADSGTFDYFTEAVVGKAKSSRGDYTASEDDNVLVQGVSRDKNAIGYFGFAYYIENQKKLKALAVDGGKGPVLPSKQSVEDGSYAPLARPIFIYVNVKSLNKVAVKEFVDFYISNAPKLVAEVKYVPLPASAYKMASEHIKSKKLGTVFAGESEAGLKIEDLLKREAKL